MESFLDRTKDADLEQLVRELASRNHLHTRRSIRLHAWKLTVKGAYAAKRLMDLAGSVLGLVLLSSVLLAIAVAVKASSPGPVIFKQTRVRRAARRWSRATSRRTA